MKIEKTDVNQFREYIKFLYDSIDGAEEKLLKAIVPGLIKLESKTK